MSKRKKQLEEFFSNYELNFNKGISGENNIDGIITDSFADCFIESSAGGIMCGKNGNEFSDKIKQGFQFYKSIGAKEMNIISKDISLVDDFHSLADIHWRYQFEKEGQQGAIDFHTYYLLNTVNEPKIFAYMAGDEQKALKEKGLVTEHAAAEHS